MCSSCLFVFFFFFFSSRRRHTRCLSDWSSDVCSSDLIHCRNPGEHRGQYQNKGGEEVSEQEQRQENQICAYHDSKGGGRRVPARVNIPQWCRSNPVEGPGQQGTGRVYEGSRQPEECPGCEPEAD